MPEKLKIEWSGDEEQPRMEETRRWIGKMADENKREINEKGYARYIKLMPELDEALEESLKQN
ncbi:MAG: hypothetical protein A3G52_04775 [Candidatus Taylorbacteria bacterium RIFCSPLOWO2_12_FULL_43_20]|uniref:Uncharacterized protein n=1 Tax=Candidatus Taylorbacteria bacterium RIFCSPLOWO2_12_FULL_43_20 TaxID=1802332 RepID=A0A1G2P4D5_9BACT|nr:MAG: hypothetical protein A2825_02765 [Candidatus Taylorbacteria bacterium RIFCSPHIGHO2_01_FULL_43_120]OHA23469.1 MAG: hypothetical protein A3B98_01320 [Candidatus Taylorbacteria bacterium RIFCSPHIGHO2_02_FULL_43_55]OHA29673.1 MAG: hypothetical protein A3E92_03625 [Candidatus Taylorbacteria bacterium RIFCSPHIGHO2_12_FULL_42_34]OHA31602.1 MAG: hypothetical protein A3B09_02720 [Candidatus Taylorbacteria bacterium RIFCSPLOWO2_01_FULL_43_83]OHA38982.1 MAG: hypothetical protein A3H58_00855 [Candi